MPEVCLMLLLPDELVTQNIIHTIKDEHVFHFLNLRNKICGTFQRICDSDEELLHVSLRDLREACKNRYVRLCFERRFREANHPEALCFEWMKSLKLIGDAATEDSGAKYFLAILSTVATRRTPKPWHCSRKSAAARRPLTAGGRTTTCGGYATSSSRISTTLCGGTCLMMAMMTTFRYCCPSRIPTSASGQWDIGATGWIPVTYQKFDCFPMCEFSQKFKTFCLNSRATKFYPNLLASHLKLRIKLKHIKIIFKLWYKCELEFSWFLFRSFQLV
jgi:hypothetical protein